MTHDVTRLTELGTALLERAGQASSRRATTAFRAAEGGQLTQVVVALLAGAELVDHDNPGEAFLQVITGRTELVADEDRWEVAAGEQVAVPQRRHRLTALEDSVALLTLIKLPR
ncbi:cupin domain-containing protein [Parenemella sanctibonifatiensis]|uniref:Cupin n=1 Tax=Parenemella sanctibonifatiensis TaxID=2016505 RepID=A0A255EA73_9ACTN|nr:hypothetical protein [Parenemella sanctibonifatiensis]OYN88474.1 cupin [Parenemella sanctibonifatiensis]